MQVFSAQWASGRYAKWRSLTWAEFRQFEARLRYESPMQVYVDLYRAVVIQGPPLEGDPIFQAPAGLVEFVAHSMLDSNPFGGEYTSVKNAMEQKRTELKQNFLSASKAIIAGIFRYTFEEIEQWDAEMFFERLAAAEFVSGRKVEPGNPNRKGRRGPQKKDLTAAQEQVVQRVAQRDPRMPMPAEESSYDPTANSEDDQPRMTKRPLTPAQEQVADRVRKQRMGR